MEQVTITPIDHARDLLRRGIKPFPVPYASKRPTITDWPNLRLTEETLPQYFNGAPSNIGGILGTGSDCIADIDLDTTQVVALATHYLKGLDTLTFGRPGKVRSHYIVRVINDADDPNAPDIKTRKFADPTSDGPEKGEIIRFGWTGTYTIFPGSVHDKTGETVQWYDDRPIVTVEYRDLMHTLERLAASALLAEHWPNGSRNDAALALAGGLLRSGFEVEEAKEFIYFVARAAYDEEAEVRAQVVDATYSRLRADQPTVGWKRLGEIIDEKVVRSVCQWLAAPQEVETLDIGKEFDAVLWTDIGNGKRFAKLYGHDFRYNVDRKKWMQWNSAYWEEVDSSVLIGRAKSVAITLISLAQAKLSQASSIVDEDARKKALKAAENIFGFAARSCNANKLADMVKMAESELSIRDAMFDDVEHNRYKLNVLNGTVDLLNNKLLPHRAEDYNTRIAHVHYDPNAKCPRWKQQVRWCVSNNSEVYHYLQKIYGLSVTGDVTYRILPIQHGNGNNGKSVLTGTMARLLHSYAWKLSVATITAKMKQDSGSAPTPDIVALKGRRFVHAAETNEGDHLDVAKIKEWTDGSNPLTGRALHSSPITFWPEFMLLISTNHKLGIQESSTGAWNRLHLIHFDNAIDPKEVIPTLAEDLYREEASGILNWLITGIHWLKEDGGVQPPKTVEEDTARYRDEQDIFGHIFEEVFEANPSGYVKYTEAYNAYINGKSDLRERGKTLQKSDFKQKMVDSGFEFKKIKGTNDNAFHGVSLKTSIICTDATPTNNTTIDNATMERIKRIVAYVYHHQLCPKSELSSLTTTLEADLQHIQRLQIPLGIVGNKLALDTTNLTDEVIAGMERI